MSDTIPTQLTDEQVERMAIVAEEMAKRGNPYGQAIFKAIQDKSPEEQRKILIMSYARLYEMLLSLQMALNSSKSVKAVKKYLEHKK